MCKTGTEGQFLHSRACSTKKKTPPFPPPLTPVPHTLSVEQVSGGNLHSAGTLGVP